ncbi:hypothetical protein ACHQM5_023983 [Ranunculus cassubicifolius]
MILISNSPPFFLHTTNPNSHLSPIYLKSSSKISRFRAIKTESDGDNKVVSPDLHRKPIISPLDSSKIHGDGGGNSESEDEEKRRDEDWVDWEDQILEDTVPLVGFVRMLLHSGKYGRGDRLSPEHEKTILERLLPYHPESEKKIGCGIDYIKVDHHPEFEESRCLFIVRKDDSFILKHFRRRSGRSNV